MAGILGIATSSLNAFQRAMAVTSNNITNLKTKGYSRQSIEFRSRPSDRYAGSFIGSGVDVANIRRNSDRFANQQVRDTLTTRTQYDTFYQQAMQLDQLFSQDGTSISTSMQSFFNALSKTNDTPDNIAARDVAISQSQLLTEQFNTMQSRLDEYRNNNNLKMGEALKQINDLASNIAELNQRLNSQPGTPELMDQRDEMIRQLAGFVDVNVLTNSDGGVDVSIGTGEVLVVGTESRALSIGGAQASKYGAHIMLEGGAGLIDITGSMHSGMIGGLLDFERDVITPGSQLIGQMAVGMATAFNDQHRMGMDMNNQIGKNFFTDYNDAFLQKNRATPAAANTGTGVMSVAFSDIGQTKLSDYDLTVTNAATNEVRMVRRSDGQVTTLNWSDTPPTPPAGQISFDGMTINMDNIGNLADNDTWIISPFSGAASDLKLNITNSRELAFASPVRTQAGSNTGDGQIVLGDLFNTTDVAKEYRIEFSSGTQYNLVNVTDGTSSGPFAFTPNQANTINIPDNASPSYSIVISGIPNTGDSFSSSYNTGGIGDNRNGLKLTGIQNDKLFNGASESVFDRYSGLIAQVGGKTHQAKLRFDAADVLHQQATDFWESKSGIDLDEEGANLMKFEEAYKAAGQLVAIANQMIDVLFASMR